MKPLKYQLKNGLTVLLVESRKSPVLSVQMWVRTGSADETPKQAGISHFIEHLVFKGTRKFGVGEIASTVEGAGGELNAYTSFDQTVFHVTISSSQGDVALEAIAEMMGHPRFDAEEIDREREVVCEEIKRGNDSPGRRNSQLMFSQSYKKHTYGRPVIGFEQIIRKVTVKTLKDYYHDRYCPRNMFLVVAGDFDKKDMKKRVENYFGDFVDYKLRKVTRAKEPMPTKPRLKVEKAPFKETMISMAWRVPSVTHKDVPALDAMALILGQGDSSRLVRRMRIEEPLVHSVGSSAFTPLNDGLMTVHLNLDLEHTPRALEILLQELDRIRNEPPTAQELSKAVILLGSEQIYSLETVDGIARSLGSQEFYLKDPNAFADYLKKLHALEPADVVRVAKKYFDNETLSVTALTDGDDATLKAQLQKFIRTKPVVAKSKAAVVKKGKVRHLKVRGLGDSSVPATERMKLPGGGLLLLRNERQTPTISVRVAFGGGVLAEPADKAGLSELFTRAWSAGGAKYDEHGLNTAFDSMAAGFGTFAGRNTAGLSADYITDFDAPVWDILDDVLFHPRLPEDVLNRERDLLLRQIKFRKDNAAQVCMRAFTQGLFGDHPYARDMQGTEESLPTITAADLIEYKETMFKRGNLAVCVTGDFSSPLIRKRMEKFAESLPAGNSLIREVPHEAPRDSVRFFQPLQKEQTHLVVGYRGLSLSDPRRWALQVMQAVLAGQGGRLFLELRDKNSLAYSVSPLRMEGLGTGYFGAYIACSPDKTEKAERMINEEFQKLIDTEIPEAELNRARNYLIGRTAIDLQRKSSICNSLIFDEIYGLDSEESLRPEDRYRAVTGADIRELATMLFAQPSVVSIVGPDKSA